MNVNQPQSIHGAGQGSQNEQLQVSLAYHLFPQQHIFPVNEVHGPFEHIGYTFYTPADLEARTSSHLYVPIWTRITYPPFLLAHPHQTLQETETLQVHDLSALSYHEVMELLGREDAALLFRARAVENRVEPIQTVMRSTLLEIEDQHRDGTINRAVGPLNAENESREEDGQSRKQSNFKRGRPRSAAGFPYLTIRNDAMLDTARRLASYGDAQLLQCLDAANHIFNQRANGTKRLDQR